MKNKCEKRERKTVRGKNREIDLITDPSTSGFYMWDIVKNGHIDSLCRHTNLRKISFLDNFQSSCSIKLIKRNVSECQQLRQKLFRIHVS